MVLHLHGNVIRVEAAFVGIADDGCLAVVGSHDDEAVVGVEDIECSNILVRLVSGD